MKIILNTIEINYWEDRPFKDEADKRSQQFREIAKVVNENTKLIEKELNRQAEQIQLILDNLNINTQSLHKEGCIYSNVSFSKHPNECVVF